MDVDTSDAPVKGFTDSNMIFINQDHLDMRFVLHLLDKFFGKVIIPQQKDVESDKFIGKVILPQQKDGESEL